MCFLYWKPVNQYYSTSCTINCEVEEGSEVRADCVWLIVVKVCDNSMQLRLWSGVDRCVERMLLLARRR